MAVPETHYARRPDGVSVAYQVLATVLFTDIVGSTELAARLGDRDWRRLLERHDEISAAEVQAAGGRMVKHTGDGLLASFHVDDLRARAGCSAHRADCAAWAGPPPQRSRDDACDAPRTRGLPPRRASGRSQRVIGALGGLRAPLTTEPQPHRVGVVGHKVICISSEDGSGAQEAALAVSSSLGFRLIDEDIVTRAAVEAGVDQEVVADVERRKSALVRLVEGLGSAGMGAGYVVAPPDVHAHGQPASDELRGLIQSVIEETAAAGSAVIVSHAASLALAKRDDVLRVLITASPQTRVSRLAADLGIDDKEAARTVKRGDAGRADYIKRFYGVSELPTHYDLVINTDKLAPQDAARLIVGAASGRDGAQAPAS
jgi:cytidylate kinase